MSNFLIKLSQIDQAQISGYIESIANNFLSTGAVTNVIGNTGNQQLVFTSNLVSFTSTGHHHLYTIPANQILLIDQYEGVSTTYVRTGVLHGTPTIQFGVSGNFNSIQSGISISGGSGYHRHVFIVPQNGITGHVTASILTGSSAFLHSGFFSVKGYLKVV